MTFSPRHIDVTFQLGPDASGQPQTFGGSGDSNTAKLSGLRVSATIVKQGSPGFNKVMAKIYGMTLAQMNQLSTLGRPAPIYGRRNTLVLEAGSDDTGMATAFVGTITDAYVDPQQPDTPFVVAAQAGFVDKLKPVPPTSIQGPADVAQLMSGFAATMGYTFENNGVAGLKLSNPYFAGTAIDQAARCAAAANIDWGLDDGTAPSQILWIKPKGQARTKPAVQIDPDHGMIDYPRYTANGVIIRTEYNPNLVYGAQATVTSEFTNANGTWTVYNLKHTLESEVFEGKWESEFSGSVLGYIPVS